MQGFLCYSNTFIDNLVFSTYCGRTTRDGASYEAPTQKKCNFNNSNSTSNNNSSKLWFFDIYDDCLFFSPLKSVDKIIISSILDSISIKNILPLVFYISSDCM